MMGRKKNPYFIAATLIAFYTLVICVSNFAVPTQAPWLHQIMMVPSQPAYLGATMLYVFILGVFSGGLFVLGLHRQKKRRSIEDDL